MSRTDWLAQIDSHRLTRTFPQRRTDSHRETHAATPANKQRNFTHITANISARATILDSFPFFVYLVLFLYFRFRSPVLLHPLTQITRKKENKKNSKCHAQWYVSHRLTRTDWLAQIDSNVPTGKMLREWII